MIAQNAPLSIGKVVLTVHDLPGVSRFYEEVVGLHLITSLPDARQLGVGNAVLLELRADAQARRRSPREAGLFHTAFLLPTRGDLARWTANAAEKRLSIQGASDHLVSEALYLADPEGNGVEIYADRPSSRWKMKNGLLDMPSDPLDIAGLLTMAGDKSWQGFPEGSVVGHVHLQVGTIAPAEAFYGGVLGFDVTCRYPGGTFYGAGGYHHHVATNIWNSRGADVRSYPSTGLADVEILAADAAVFEAVKARVEKAGTSAVAQAGSLSLRDPWATSITLATKKA